MVLENIKMSSDKIGRPPSWSNEADYDFCHQLTSYAVSSVYLNHMHMIHVALSFDGFDSILWLPVLVFIGSFIVFTFFCFPDFQLFWPEYHWNSRNEHMVHFRDVFLHFPTSVIGQSSIDYSSILNTFYHQPIYCCHLLSLSQSNKLACSSFSVTRSGYRMTTN
jgi:hypothetical protein